MGKESTSAWDLPSLEKRAASNDPITWESYAADRCARAGEESDDPIVSVLRSKAGRANPARFARLTAAIEYVGRVDTLRLLLHSDLGRANPERACELALADSKIMAADALKEDFDPRDIEKEY
jgi:hypothetical protein